MNNNNMDANQQHSGSKGLFLLGVGLGAAIGLLLAPRSGEEIRRTIRESTNKGRETLGQRGHELSERARGVIEKGKEYILWGRETVNSAVSAGKQAYHDKQHAGNHSNSDAMR